MPGLAFMSTPDVVPLRPSLSPAFGAALKGTVHRRRWEALKGQVPISERRKGGL